MSLLLARIAAAHRPSVAIATPFGLGDGIKTAFQLVDARGRPITRNASVSAIHETDWQGRQLLYPTARTNKTIRGGMLYWSTSGTATYTSASQPAPDGSGNAAQVAVAGGGAGGGIFRSAAAAMTAGSVWTYSLHWRYVSGNSQVKMILGSSPFPTARYAIFDLSDGSLVSSNAAPLTSVYLGGGWWRLAITAIAAATGSAATYANNSTPDASTYNLWGSQVESGTVVTRYIPTNTSTTTVTDYTVGSSGTVSRGEIPVSGAALDWDGAGIS